MTEDPNEVPEPTVRPPEVAPPAVPPSATGPVTPSPVPPAPVATAPIKQSPVTTAPVPPPAIPASDDLPPPRPRVDPEDIRKALEEHAKRRPPRPPVNELLPPIPKLKIDKPRFRKHKP